MSTRQSLTDTLGLQTFVGHTSQQVAHIFPLDVNNINSVLLFWVVHNTNVMCKCTRVCVRAISS